MKITFVELIDLINTSYIWDFTEMESPNCHRFDDGEGDLGSSLWLYRGDLITAEGKAPKSIQKLLKKHNITFTEL